MPDIYRSGLGQSQHFDQRISHAVAVVAHLGGQSRHAGFSERMIAC